MKEITRIHLAKVAYDIEVDAKKDIQQYIAALERYADDPELLDDIEIRITELLAERGVVAGGVIAKDDVAAVRAQLGEPSDFAPEGMGDIAVGAEVDDSPRKLYRDRDSAILGGVLAGMARFFGIDPLWTRLIFIVLLIASFGAAFIIYLILWLIVPSAKTAAEKLQMRGKPVTLASIKKLGERENVEINSTAEVTRRVLRIATGIVALIGATGVLVVTLFIGFGLTFGTTDNSPIAAWRPQEAWWIALTLGLFVLAGLLLATLGFVLSNALFRRQWTKKIGTAVVIIIAVGLLSFFSGVGTMWYGTWQEGMRLYNSRNVSTAKLPALAEATSLVIKPNEWAHSELRVEYIVSSNARYELDTVTDTKPRFTYDGDMVTVSLEPVDRASRESFAFITPTILRIYGPALDRLEAQTNVNLSYYSEKPQTSLAITLQSAGFELRGTYDVITIAQREGGTANLGGATVKDLIIDNQGGLVEAGVVRTLNVTQPDACPATSGDESNNMVRVQSIASGKLFRNNEEQAVKTIRQDCGTVFIWSSEEFDERYEE